MSILEAWSSDATLVNDALADRPAAFEALVLRYQRKAHAIARAIGVRADSLDDVVQEAFLSAFCGLRDLRSPAAFGPWLLQIVRNLSRKHLSRSHRPEARLEEALEGGEEPRAGQEIESEDVREVGDRVHREVQALPESLREAIYLYYYEGCSTRRVARTLEISTGAVKARLLRGRGLLRDRLWRSLEDSLREMLPSARSWKSRGRKLALVVLASVAMDPLKAAASGGAAGAAGAGAAWIHRITLGVLLMNLKKITIGLAAALLLFSGGLVLLQSRPRRAPESTDPAAIVASRAGRSAPVASEEAAGAAKTGSTAPARVARPGIAGRVFLEGAPGPAGVRVAALEKFWGEHAGRAESAADGTYAIAGLKPGRYRLRAWSGTWTTAWNDPEQKSVEVREGQTTQADLTLVPGVLLKGQVLEETSRKPIPGARVEWALQSTPTDGEGRFTLEGVPPGSLLLVVNAAGFARDMESHALALGEDTFLTVLLAPGGAVEGTVKELSGETAPRVSVGVEWDSGTAGGETGAGGRFRIEGIPLSTREIRVSASRAGLFATQAVVPGFPPGESRVVVDLRLTKGFALKGLVVDKIGAPVAGAEVIVGGSGVSARTVADTEGRFSFEGASESAISLTASKPGFAPGTISTGNLPPEGREDLRITLEPAHFLAGRVEDARGNPVAGAGLNAETPDGNHASSARTDAEGRFRMGDLPPRLGRLHAVGDGYASLQVQNVEVDRDDVRLVLEDAGQILGIAVARAGGEPVHPVRVKVQAKTDDGGTWSSAWRRFDSPDGGFKIRENLTAGRSYQLTLAADEYGEAEVDGVQAWPWSESRDPVRVELEKGGALRGQVLDAKTRKPLAGARVSHAIEKDSRGSNHYWPSAAAVHGLIRSAVSDGEGRFSLGGLAESAGTVFVEKTGYARSAFSPVTAGADLQVFELEASAALEGAARARDGRPIGGARVSVSVGGLVFPDTRTDDGGRYRLEDLPPGPCTVEVDRRFLGFMGQKPRTGVLEAGRVTVLDFEEPSGSASGRVTTRRGAPVPEARVVVRNLADREAHLASYAVDGAGFFRIGGFTPGPYELSVNLPGRSLAETPRRKVEVGDGDTACDFAINLEAPVATVTGRVLDRITGNPVPGARVVIRERGKGYFVCGDLKMPGSEWLPCGEAVTEGSEHLFRLEVFTAGSYLLTASSEKDGRLLGWLGPLQLGPSKKPLEVDIPLGGPGVLTLQVVDAGTRQPVEGAAVLVRPAQGYSAEFQARTDGAGRASVAGLPPGPYQILVHSGKHSLHREALEVPAGGIERAMALERASSIAVRLEGTPRESAEYYVRAIALSGGDPGWDYVSGEDQPAACGRYQPGKSPEPLIRLKARPGRYRVRFQVSDLGREAAPVTTETLELEVTEAGEASVRLALPAD